MPVRHAKADENEPTESNFPLPKEGEHLFQVVDGWQDKVDSDVQVVKLEIVGGEDTGKTILQRINTNDQLKSFYYTRLFLKAIDEAYKGEFDIDTDNFIGKQFYAMIVHNGKYANISEYNFNKKIEQYKAPKPVIEGADVNWEE